MSFLTLTKRYLFKCFLKHKFYDKNSGSSSMILLILIVFVVKNVVSYNLLDFYSLPKIYKMENYTNCMSENNLYCELEFEVKSANNGSKFWKIIQNYDAEESFYDRKILFRAMCLPKLYKNEKVKLKEIGLAKMKNELESYDLDADLINFNCKLSFTHTFRDVIVINFVCVYITWIFIASIIDYITKGYAYNFFKSFSVIHNYKILTKKTKNPHYIRLKFMQGVRLYCILFVVVGHSLLAYISMYSENPEFFEELYSDERAVFFIYFLSLLVPTFFILSGWLSVLKLNVSKFSIQDGLLLLINRLLRYAPILLFASTFNSSFFFTNNLPCTKMVDRFLINCKIGWSYIFIQNWFYPSETCNPHFWSLSVDIQCYVILLIAFYIITKYKLPIIRSLSKLCLFFILIQSIIMCYNNSKALFKITARNILPISRKNSDISLNYMSTIANAPSYLIGSIFGILYLRNINNKIFEPKIMKMIWFLTTTGLVVSAIYLTDNSKSRLARSIYGSLLKPIYVTGVAVLFFGLAQDASRELRKFFEMRIVEILGKCTLSIYVLHTSECFKRTYESSTETKIVLHKFIFGIVGDVLKSFLAGFVFYLTVEQPFAMLTTFHRKEAKKNDKEKI